VHSEVEPKGLRADIGSLIGVQTALKDTGELELLLKAKNKTHL
jgi:hypothetical protein